MTLTKHFILIFSFSLVLPLSTARAECLSLSTDICVSSFSVYQADTISLKISNKGADIFGSFDNEKIDFFKNQNNEWAGIIGIPVHKNPGTYRLLVGTTGNNFVSKDIQIIKSEYPTKPLLITNKLSTQGYTAKNIKENVNLENTELYKTLKTNTTTVLSKSFINPLAKMVDIGAFGNIRENGSYKLQHLGVDLEANVDTPIYAINDGIVTFAKNMKNYGNTLVLNHGMEISSLYLHLNSFKVREGQTVKQGEVIGFTGNSGYSIVPHLHFSIKIKGESIDPLRMIQTVNQE